MTPGQSVVPVLDTGPGVSRRGADEESFGAPVRRL